MNSLSEVHLEMNLRKWQTEREQRERLSTLFRSPAAKDAGIQQIAGRLVDFVAEVRCQLESRFASAQTATACEQLTAVEQAR